MIKTTKFQISVFDTTSCTTISITLHTKLKKVSILLWWVPTIKKRSGRISGNICKMLCCMPHQEESSSRTLNGSHGHFGTNATADWSKLSVVHLDETSIFASLGNKDDHPLWGRRFSNVSKQWRQVPVLGGSKSAVSRTNVRLSTFFLSNFM